MPVDSDAAPPDAREEAGDAAARAGKRDVARSWRQRITITALIAVVALLTGSVDLVYRLWPSLRKDPGNEHAAEIEVLAMDKNVSYGSYMRRPGATAADQPIAAKTNGNVVYLQMQMHGFKGSRARLRWYTYNADNGVRLPRPFSTGHDFRAKAPSNKSISVEWVPLPNAAASLKTYRIRFELYDADDVLLAFADSNSFTITPRIQLPTGA